MGDIKPNQYYYNYNPQLKVNDISKEDYSEILTEEKQSLGNITVNNLYLDEVEIGFLMYNNTYPLVGEDYASGALNMARINLNFIETLEPAIQDNLNQEITDNNRIEVKMNETFEITYSNPQAGYLLYLPRLHPNKILEVYVNDGISIIELVNETDFTIDERDFLVFNYKNFFRKGPNYNFEMYIIWQYQLVVQDWRIIQYSDQNLRIKNNEEDFTVKFNYYFRLLGRKFGETIKDDRVIAENIDVALTMNLPDMNLLDYQSFLINNETVNINDHVNLDNSIDIYLLDYFTANQSWVSLNFSADFTFKFYNSVEKSWAIDRLYYGGDVREKIYLPSIIGGPNHIYVQDLYIYDYSIFIQQILSTSSPFKRDVDYYFLNSSIVGREGIEIRIPYMVVGEICPCIIRYSPTQNLRLVITDNIKMPLVGASVDMLYYGKVYGTYISNDSVQPIAIASTDEHGEIIVDNVPYGNYTIRVYYNGIFLKEQIVSTKNSINYIYTNFPHFPIWLIIFGGINGIILLVGIIFYLINKNKH
ncbi:MAG: hypothetical protein ACFFEY_17145 [Candidatus Thorarchaeota archaeon]